MRLHPARTARGRPRTPEDTANPDQMYALIRPTCRSGSVEGSAMVVNFWSDMMLPGVPIAEKVLRPILVYCS